jgi:hypothetical protein
LELKEITNMVVLPPEVEEVVVEVVPMDLVPHWVTVKEECHPLLTTHHQEPPKWVTIMEKE